MTVQISSKKGMRERGLTVMMTRRLNKVLNNSHDAARKHVRR